MGGTRGAQDRSGDEGDVRVNRDGSHADSGHEIATLFIRIQSYREQCWRAHIARRHRDALELAVLTRVAAEELERRLS